MTYDQWRVKDQEKFPDQMHGHTYAVAERAFAAGRKQGLAEVLTAADILSEAVRARGQQGSNENAEQVQRG